MLFRTATLYHAPTLRAYVARRKAVRAVRAANYSSLTLRILSRLAASFSFIGGAKALKGTP